MDGNQVTPQLSAKAIREEAVRVGKRFLLSTIRDDWQYPASEQLEDATRVPVGYALRTEGPSDGENEDSGGGYYGSPTTKHNPYKFENPDAVGTKVLERRKRRRQRAEEELKWNEGMANWARQRDAWTQARPDRAKQPRTTSDSTTTVGSKPRHLSDSTDGSISPSSHDSLGRPAPTSSIESIEPDTLPPSSLDQTTALDETQGPWLPIYPPLLPDTNPVRANIRPAAYDHIYSKVVIQALTPSLPIPLTHMTYALVEGWKADGAWPPQPADPTHPPTTTTIGSTAQKKARSVLSAIRIRSRSHHNTPATVAKGVPQRKQAPAHTAPHPPSTTTTIPTTIPTSNPPSPTSVRRSIDTVKRALGLQRDPDSPHSHNSPWSSGGSRRASRAGDFGIDFEDSSQQQLEHEPERENELNVELNRGLLLGRDGYGGGGAAAGASVGGGAVGGSVGRVGASIK